MDIRDVISGRQQGIAAGLLRCGLTCLVPFYAVAVAARNQAFDLGWHKVRRVPRPVMSVGNLTTGGTGKTPMVAWLANHLQTLGRRPVLLSRGYKSLDGQENDEKRLLDQLCPGIPHLQNRDRVRSAAAAFKQNLGDVCILDDGFQHRRLHRDLDIVLIDAVEPWGYGRLLPRGLLREPMRALRRADVVVITRSELASLEAIFALRTEIQRYTSAPIAVTRFQISGLVASDGQRAPMESLRAKSAAAFCGIGNPSAFEQTLRQEIGRDLKGFRGFPDHHHYSTGDVEALAAWSATSGAECLVTTRKDLVKLNRTTIGNCRLWAIDIELVITDGERDLLAAIRHALEDTSETK